MNTPKIEIIGQEHEVVRPDESGVPVSTSVAGGIVVKEGGRIVSFSRRKQLGIEQNNTPSDVDLGRDHPSSGSTSTSRWVKVESPRGGRRLIG